MSQLLTDDSEIVFEQSGETAEAMEQAGLIPSRRKEETELEDTQPHDGTRRKAMEFDRPVEEELEAAWSGVNDNVICIVMKFRIYARNNRFRMKRKQGPPHVGNHGEWKANNLRDLMIG